MNLGTRPRHLVILGGGPVGLEFAQMFARFGSRVSVIEMHDRLLPDEDRDVADAMLEILCYEDIDIRLGSQIKRVDPTCDGNFQLHVASDGDQVQTMTVSHFLVAAGRRPNTDWLNLEKAGIRTDAEGFVMTDEYLQTSVPQIYALGDVRGGPAFTHIAYDDFRTIRTNLLEDGHVTTENRPVPYVIFTDPELGRVGLTEHDARQQGYNIKVGKIPMSRAARAVEMGETQGLMKVIVDADTDQILGCAILGVHGGEVMSALQIAMMGRVPYTAIRDGIFAHPTLTESLNTLFMTIDD
jgi:pyruvate/2-oxoglutarate dehydrogenase complex dihydrolipoamide dehydrogenase (E3) component